MPNSSDLRTITEINLDVNTPGISIIHAKQYDTARKVKAHLFYNGVRWYVPDENVIAVVSYKKADRIGGFYDTTEDGQTAVAIDGEDGSSIYISLDRQLLTTIGNVNVEITFYHSINVSRLSTFSFIVQVEAASLTELDLASNPYFNVLAKDIAAVLHAEQNITGITASATKVAPGASDIKPSVTGGTEGVPYNIEFKIPTFAGINTTPTVNTLAPGSSATASISGGTSGTSKYSFTFGIPKGDKGDTGNPASPTGITYQYAVSSSGTTVPPSGWGKNVAPVQGSYYWAKATITWNNGGTSIVYNVSYIGADGTGAVNRVNNKTGNVVLTAADLNQTRGTTTTTIQADLNSLHTNKAELIRATNVTVPNDKWAQMTSSDTDYASVASTFPYKGTLDSTVESVFTDVKASMFAQIVFGIEDAMSGNYAPITKCDAGKVYIYAMTPPSSDDPLVIPSIIVFKLEGDT